MSELPKNWSKALIEDLLEDLDVGKRLHQGWSPRCHKEPSEDDNVWGVLKTTAIQKGEFQSEHNKRLPDNLEPRPNIEVKAGDLLLTCAGPRKRCGIPCLIRTTRPKLMMSGKMYRFRADRTQIEPEYLEAFLLSNDAQDAIDRMKTGISESGLNLTHGRFKTLEVPVAPIPEQRRIVARIEELFSRLDAGVAALRLAKAQLKRYRQSVLAAAVTGQLTQAWREQHGATLNDWQQTTLGDESSLVTSGSRGWAKYYADEGPLFIRAQNIKTDALVLDDLAHVQPPVGSEGKRTQVFEHDLLITITGANVTKSAVVKDPLGEAYVSQHVALVRPSDPRHAPFLYYAIISPRNGRAFLEEKAYGAGKPGLNLTNVKEVPIGLPPLAEQLQILAEVEARTTAIDHVEAELDRQITRSTHLRQATLASAFAGQL